MNDVQSLNSQQQIQKLLNTTGPEQLDSNKEALGKDAFLRLMITQLNNQDPLSPQDNSEFVAQLAQFSTVEGIGNLNNSFSSFASNMSSSQALQASSLVGRNVQVKTNVAGFNGTNSVKGFVDLPAATGQVDVSVFSPSGDLVKVIPMGTLAAGDHTFSWNGLDENGAAVPAGNYSVRADALIDGDMTQIDTYVGVNVDSVTLAAGGDVSLNLSGIGNVPLSQIRTIN